ncbi:GRB10-interacting GYF protein 2-like [Benincasa hispida]|uniref:GRB10-interacting GYF protein 2-like n=1 Tax=Benincasa hispida TaxID=102211 RepID=UPI001901A8B9|nr:GRB10-interacting GYF protein 2-like [Benincasa hispida]
MEQDGGLSKAGVVNQLLPQEEVAVTASQEQVLALADPKENALADSNEGLIRAVLEDVESRRRTGQLAKEKEADEVAKAQRRRERKEKKKNEDDEDEEKGRLIIASIDLTRRLHDEEVCHVNALEEENTKKKLEDECLINLASEQFEKELKEEEEAEKRKKEEKKLLRRAKVQRNIELKRKEIEEWEKEKVDQEREMVRMRRQRARLAVVQDNGEEKVEGSKSSPALRCQKVRKEIDDRLMEMGFFPTPNPLPNFITSIMIRLR